MCVCARVLVCMRVRARALIAERLIPFWISVLTCNIKLATGLSPLYLPVTFPSLIAVNSLGPSPVPPCPLSSVLRPEPWGQARVPQLPSALTGFFLRCPQVFSARELPSESYCYMYVTLTRNGPHLCWGAGHRWGSVFQALGWEYPFPLAPARRKENWGLSAEGG